MFFISDIFWPVLPDIETRKDKFQIFYAWLVYFRWRNPLDPDLSGAGTYSPHNRGLPPPRSSIPKAPLLSKDMVENQNGRDNSFSHNDIETQR